MQGSKFSFVITHVLTNHFKNNIRIFNNFTFGGLTRHWFSQSSQAHHLLD